MDKLLNELQELQNKKFDKCWKELGRLIIINDLKHKLLDLIRKEIKYANKRI